MLVANCMSLVYCILIKLPDNVSGASVSGLESLLRAKVSVCRISRWVRFYVIIWLFTSLSKYISSMVCVLYV